MIWVTSDLHLGHEGVIKYCKRPFPSLLAMHEALISLWNARVRPEDTVFVLGDLSFMRFAEFLPIALRLNGKKILVKGNHDHYSDSQYNKAGFAVYHEIKMKLAGFDVRMSHYPYALPWHRRLFAYPSELRFMDRRPPKVPGEFLLHGHTHTKHRLVGNRIHVGVDAWDFRPVALYELESLMMKKKEGRI